MKTLKKSQTLAQESVSIKYTKSTLFYLTLHILAVSRLIRSYCWYGSISNNYLEMSHYFLRGKGLESICLISLSHGSHCMIFFFSTLPNPPHLNKISTKGNIEPMPGPGSPSVGTIKNAGRTPQEESCSLLFSIRLCSSPACFFIVPTDWEQEQAKLNHNIF